MWWLLHLSFCNAVITHLLFGDDWGKWLAWVLEEEIEFSLLENFSHHKEKKIGKENNDRLEKET